MKNNIIFRDNTEAVLSALENTVSAALGECGEKAVRYAKQYAPVGTPESTGIPGYQGGKLKRSLSFKTFGNACCIGTSVKSKNGAPYSVFLELGTLRVKPRHFLRNAVIDNKSDILKGFTNK